MGLAAALLMWLRLNRRLWFFGDDWEFLLSRGVVPGVDRGLWAPHNEHWSTIPILVYRVLYALFGLDHYLPYVVPVLLAHIGCCLLLYVLIVRCDINRWVAVGCALFMAFLGSGAENTTWAFQVGFVGSVFFGLLAVLLLDLHLTTGWRVGFVWLAAVLGLMCSGVGVSMVILVAAFAVIRGGVRKALVVASVPAVVYLAWYAVWGRSGIQPPAARITDYLNVPDFVWTGLVSTWERNTGIAGSGAVVVLGILAAASLVGRTPARALALAGVAAAFAQQLLAGVSRIEIGAAQAAASRYAYLLTALLLPAVALVVDWALRRPGRPTWVVAVLASGLFGLFLVNDVKQAVQYTDSRAELIGDLPQRVAATVALTRSGAPILTPLPSPTHNPDITVPRLLAAADRLPAIPVSSESQLATRSALLVSVSGASALPQALGVSLSGLTPAAQPGCQPYQAGAGAEGLTFPVAGGGSQVRVSGSEREVSTRLVAQGQASPWLAWSVPAGQPVFIASTAAGDTLEVSLDVEGSTTICTG